MNIARHWPWFVSLVVALATVVVVVAHDGDAESPRARAGLFVASNYEMHQPTDTVSLQLPVGRFDITLTAALRSVDDDGFMAGRRPPEGGSFVGVTSAVSRLVSPRSLGGAAVASTPIRLTLLAGDRSYPVVDDSPADRIAALPRGALVRGWLAVDGSPRDLRVAVDFDGVRQVVDPATGTRDPGRAAALYAPEQRAQRDTGCGAATLSPGYRFPEARTAPTCLVEGVSRTPWIGGLGWAPAGHTWLIVDVYVEGSVSVVGTGAGRQEYRSTRDTALTMTLAGQASAGRPATNRASLGSLRSGASVGVFSVPTRSAAVEVDVTLTARRLLNRSDTVDPAAPVDPTVRLSWQAPVS